MIVRNALEVMPIHPEIVKRTDYLLSGILARLGCLLSHLRIPDPVADVTPLTEEYLDELSRWAILRARAMREAAESADGR